MIYHNTYLYSICIYIQILYTCIVRKRTNTHGSSIGPLHRFQGKNHSELLHHAQERLLRGMNATTLAPRQLDLLEVKTIDMAQFFLTWISLLENNKAHVVFIGSSQKFTPQEVHSDTFPLNHIQNTSLEGT